MAVPHHVKSVCLHACVGARVRAGAARDTTRSFTLRFLVAPFQMKNIAIILLTLFLSQMIDFRDKSIIYYDSLLGRNQQCLGCLL